METLLKLEEETLRQTAEERPRGMRAIFGTDAKKI